MNQQIIGVAATGWRVAVGLVEGVELISHVQHFPGSDEDEIHSMPLETIASGVAETILRVSQDHKAVPKAVGVGFPGLIRCNVIEESPNLKQLKGARLAESLTAALAAQGLSVPVFLYNDADVMATGVAATRGQLESLIRVWTLGHGIGYGRYPHSEGVWEGGHMVVTLDPKEDFCGCGGRGHLEGIMGHRAMRLRFLDLEPDEIFANARQAEPDARCAAFELLWHRALAAASATSIHLDGPGKFFISGPNARFIKVSLLSQYLHEMVTMSTLQGSVFEVVPTNDEIAIVGAAVNARLDILPVPTS